MTADGNEDLALAALYQRLFVLQDKRREVELRSDEAELSIDDLALAYHKFDDRMTKELLKEIAVDPELKRVARDADEVKALIAENLARRPKPPVKP